MQAWIEHLPAQTVENAMKLARRAEEERQRGAVIYPPQENIFRALEITPPEKVKVVLVGQDPYHGAGQANGLAFSVHPGVRIPPSLRNIFKELQNDLDIPMPASGDLTHWAEQGVLLLNTVLTVQEGKPNSHKSWGWQNFTLEVFRACTRLPQPVVFLLWGGQARAFTSGLTFSGTKAVLCSSHPSPLGASQGTAAAPAFLGSRPFSGANRLLESMGASPVDWSL